MRRRLRFAGFVFLVLLVRAAGPQATAPPGRHEIFPYTYATAIRGCTQEDAPAVEVFFTQSVFTGGDPAAPYMHFEISSMPSEKLPPTVFPLEGLRREPGRQGRIVRGEWATEGQRPVWLKGTFAIVSMEPDRYLNGHFRVEMPDGRIAESGFVAKYVPHRAVCGG